MRVGDRWYRAMWWDEGAVAFVDQRFLPHRFEIARVTGWRDAAAAIHDMAVRGAPTIGVMAAYGLALAAAQGEDPESAYWALLAARPTAVNLKVGLDAVMPHVSTPGHALDAARAHDDAEVRSAEAIGEAGLGLLGRDARIGTHCNAGWLAAQDWGTALSPIYKAKLKGWSPRVFVDETRPRLQGSRITAWELGAAQVDYTVIADGAAASLLRRKKIDLVITGADRIALNGDVANKIGTYPLALAARANGIPFYVAAPSTTFDLRAESGDAIPIEERDPEEVLAVEGRSEAGDILRLTVTPEGAQVCNPAFDITPAELVTGLITESGVFPAGPDGVLAAARARHPLQTKS